MDAEQAHRRLVSLCAAQIDPVPPRPTRGPRVYEMWQAEAEKKAELVIRIVRKWDRGERF